jgi:hypothetical protein
VAETDENLDELVQEEARLTQVANAVSELMGETAEMLATLTKEAITVSAQLKAVREKLALAKDGRRVLAA